MRYILLVVVLASSLAAQDLGVKAAPQKRPVVIRNAVIHTISGDTIRNGVIWFDRGVIHGIAEADKAPQDLVDPLVLDAGGKHVYPGLIASNTTLGLVEIGSVRATRDTSELGDVTPEVRAAVAVNPDSTVIPVTRANGILTAAVLPQGGLIPGRASVIGLEGWTWEDMTVLDDAGLVVSWPTMRSFRRRFGRRPGSQPDTADRARSRQAIEDAFAAARAYVKAKDADAGVLTDIRWEAMRAVLSGKRPVFLLASELEQIQSAVSWALSEGLKPVVVGGRDAALCAGLLRRHDVPVIVTGTHRMPKRRDSAYDEPFRLPAELEAMGVRWCLASGGSFYNERNLPYHAATAVAHGLEPSAALRAITLSAAEILGVADRLGSLEVGKAATLIVTDGNPLDIRSNVRHAFIDGKQIDLSNKQTELAAKYREKYRQLGLLPVKKEGT